MKITTISKRLGYFVWAMGGLTYNTLDAFIRAAYKTLYKGEKVHWVYQSSVTPEQANVLIANQWDKDEPMVIPVDEPKKPRKVNRYHLRYQFSARGV